MARTGLYVGGRCCGAFRGLLVWMCNLPLGLRRLVADPDSPTSRLLERAAQRSLAASANSTPDGKSKFSYLKDIVRNPEVARAARAALSSSPEVVVGGGAARGGAGNGALQPLQSSPELDSLTAVVDQLDGDAGQESRINQQMASVALGRLTAGRGAAERTLSVLQVRCRPPASFAHLIHLIAAHLLPWPSLPLPPSPRDHPCVWQACAAAEAAYARALSSVAKLSLCSEADGPSLRAALEQFSDLPMMMGTAHSSVRGLGGREGGWVGGWRRCVADVCLV